LRVKQRELRRIEGDARRVGRLNARGLGVGAMRRRVIVGKIRRVLAANAVDRVKDRGMHNCAGARLAGTGLARRLLRVTEDGISIGDGIGVDERRGKTNERGERERGSDDGGRFHGWISVASSNSDTVMARTRPGLVFLCGAFLRKGTRRTV